MKNRIKVVTAASLFDGHDASINIMRRILQAKGAEVIHLGHNRSVKDVVKAVIEEDAQAVAISSYQGGHNEYFLYLRELLDSYGANKVKIFGGGGGVITPEEIRALESKGIERIYSPKDGEKLGLEGIIEDILKRSDYSTTSEFKFIQKGNQLTREILAKCLTQIENGDFDLKNLSDKNQKSVPVLGVTGTGGAGKSSLIDELLIRFNKFIPDFKIALLSIDPTKSKTKGALLGDRIRLGSSIIENFFIRSFATRDSKSEVSQNLDHVVNFLKTQDFHLILIETSGIGQSSSEIINYSDKSLYVMTPEFGAATQLEKIDMLDHADFVAINKFEKPRSEDAYRDVRKQWCRNRNLFHLTKEDEEKLPVYGTRASVFNDSGINALFFDLVCSFDFKLKLEIGKVEISKKPAIKNTIIPVDRVNYLREISKALKDYNIKTAELSKNLKLLDAFQTLESIASLKEEKQKIEDKIPKDVFKALELFDRACEEIQSGSYEFIVRDKKIQIETKYESLAELKLPKVAIPKFSSLDQKIRFIRNQNLPGFFPFSAGIFPFKRKDEDPKRMFAGEGGPTRTNSRFHYLSKDDPFKRLSTAFDSVTLYGRDPSNEPDIYGKIGESGVSIATLEDMDALFAGFDLIDPKTSVSMTINGPAPIILAMFMNTAINQKLSSSDKNNIEKCVEVMRNVRGTVQADILKEDQAQNTCIFSLDFALKMMGDVQEYFSKNMIRNYYTVSISGYHIAEAGANPITQVAFTLANGFTYAEYYLARGISVDSFCENFSFFFSNGLDPEYAVIGQVARKIWAVALRDRYGASEKSQKFKYHIQTSGRSLHAQEIDFNDIRTTLQALIALGDNCNSLHTNAYDEAITTPTAESVRRAMAIQMIINKEFGLMKTDNPFQGSFLYDELFEIVENAILGEFERISDKGGVLGAMESQYQRSKIQDESLKYEMMKDNGSLPIIGVNTYKSKDASDDTPIPLTRASYDEKDRQIERLNSFKEKNAKNSAMALDNLRKVVESNQNIFAELMTTVRYCSLGEITELLFTLGGQYRRNV